MNTIKLSLLLISSYFLHGINEDPVVISLGYRCQVALQLRIHNLRKEAFPFDWMITPFESLYRLLENDFEDFLQPEKLIFRKRFLYQDDWGEFKGSYPHIWESKYNLLLRHDFDLLDNFIEQYSVVASKYERRIIRFYNTLNSGKHVYFFRRVITKNQAQVLRDLLVKKFPTLSFTLVAISYYPEAKQDWTIPNVKNFYVPIPSPYNRSGSNAAWGKVFKQLGLVEEPVHISNQQWHGIIDELQTLFAQRNLKKM